MQRFITRTIKMTKVSAKVYNADTKSIEEKELILSGKLEGKELDKAIEKTLENTGYKFLSAEATEVVTKGIKMPEEKFIAEGEEFDPRTADEKAPVNTAE